MSDNARKRKLTRLRVQKHRAIKTELRHECQNDHVPRSNLQDVETDLDARLDDSSENEPRTSTAPNSDFSTMHENTDTHDDQNSSDTADCNTLDDSTENLLAFARSHSNDSFHNGSDNEQCGDEVEEIRRLAIESNMCCSVLDKLLRILRRRLLPQLPKSSKTFLKSAAADYNITEMADCSGENGQFVYFGIAKGLQKCVNTKLHKDSDTSLQLQFNIDGMPIAKSSFTQVWPILCRVFYNPTLYKPFAVAIYCGASKPACMDTFLRQFIEEMNALSNGGLVIDGKHFQVFIHSFICDTPARALLKCVKGHTGFDACERCNVQGFKVNWTTVFPSINCEERTDASFRNRNHPEHHSFNNSPLLQLQPPIDMVKSFILDSMHLLSGVMKKLITYWVSGNLRSKLSLDQRKKLSARLEYLKPYVPFEFQRKPRAVKYIAKWKATELRFFLLYCGAIVLKGILIGKLYDHFMLLHAACRILCSSKLALKRNKYAKIYLHTFFSTLKQFYTPASQVINTHNLLHIADDAVNMECDLTQISAFPFENMLGTVIKKCIRTQNRPLAQICRRLHEQQSIHKKVIPRSIVKVLKYRKNEGIDNLVVDKIRFQGFTLSKKIPDNIVLLVSNEILKIEEIKNNVNDMTILGSVWKIKSSIFTYPCDSKHLQMWELVNKPSSRKLCVNIHCIQTKMVLLKLPQITNNFNRSLTRVVRKFVMPFLHADE